MGLFGYFRRRKERESPVPADDVESLTKQLKGDGTPVGQPIGETLPQQPSFDWAGGTDMGSVLALMQQAFASGNHEITQGENQVIDMRGTGLREQIMEAMRQHGIDPENATAQGQINAADYAGLQQQIMDALREHGVDVAGADGGTSVSGDQPSE
jgi:hypothetical protein